jgi:hypothetical protein
MLLLLFKQSVLGLISKGEEKGYTSFDPMIGIYIRWHFERAYKVSGMPGSGENTLASENLVARTHKGHSWVRLLPKLNWSKPNRHKGGKKLFGP